MSHGKGKRPQGFSVPTRVPARVAAPADEAVIFGADGSVTIDMRVLPVPQNSYDADVAWIEARVGHVSLMFAKLGGAKRQRMRSRLQVKYPAEDFYRFFWLNSRDFEPRLTDYVNRWPGSAMDLPTNLEEMEPEKEHSEWANFDRMSHAGTQGSLALYLMQAMVVAGRDKTGPVPAEILPVVQVRLDAFTLLHLLRSAKAVADSIEKAHPLVLNSKVVRSEGNGR